MAGGPRAAAAAGRAARRRGHPHSGADPGAGRGGGPLTTAASAAGSGTGAPPRTATFRDLFGIREFRALFGTFVLSNVGDELARVALTVLVYQRTHSPLLSAITFTLGYLPWLVGGPVLAAFADRLPRHRVLVVTDAVRAVLVAAMAIPGTPLPVLLVLLLLLSLGAPPFESARSALQADIVEGDRYALASSLTGITLQISQVVGFLLAGALVALLTPAAALLFDAATFLVSAGWLWSALQRRPAPAEVGHGSLWQDTVEGLRFIARSSRTRAIVGVLWAANLFLYAPEGLAVPFARQLGQGATGVGILLAASPLGMIVGALVVGRFVSSERRERLLPPLVLLSLVPLAAAGGLTTTATPGPITFAAVALLMFLSGLGSAWGIPLNLAYVQAVPVSFRGRAFGVAMSGLYGVQALGILAAGALAESLTAGGVVAVAGVLGSLVVLAPLVALRRTTPVVASGAAAAGPSVA